MMIVLPHAACQAMQAMMYSKSWREGPSTWQKPLHRPA